MNPQPPKVIKLIVFCIAIIFNFSCSKDSDVQSEYVESDVSTGEDRFTVDDVFIIDGQDAVILDVLSNDGYTGNKNIKIIQTSEPNEGSVVINEDNTLTYVPETQVETSDTTMTPEKATPPPVATTPQDTTSTEATEDVTEVNTFTYTSEAEDGDGGVTTEVGNVTITVAEDASRDFSGMDLSTFGVVGDGITDDTKAIQAAIDSGNDLFAKPGLTFLVTPTAGTALITGLQIENNGDQNIDWNGGTITTNATGDDMRFMYINKPSGTLSMSDLTIDGNAEAGRGIFFETPVNLTNVDVTNFMNSGIASWDNSYGIGGRVGKGNGTTNQGDSVVDGCDCSFMFSDNNNNGIGDAQGTTRCYLWIWDAVPSSTITPTFKNATLTDMWGEDSDAVAISQNNNITMKNSDSRVIFDNLYITKYARRGLKSIGENVTLKNSTIEAYGSNHPDNPNSSNLGPAGMVTFTNHIHGSSVLAENQKLENCTFIGIGTSYNNSWNVLTFSNGQGGTVNNCNFQNGATLRYSNYTGDGYVCNTSFGTGCYLNDVGIQNNGILGIIHLDTDITAVESDWNRLDSYSYAKGTIVDVDLDCQ